MSPGRVAVVLATPDPGPTTGPGLEGFLREVRDRGEVVLVATSATRPGGRDPDLRVVETARVGLVPEQWRDGLARTDAEFVAFSTTQMVPRVGWLDAMLGRLAGSRAWGVGGTIEPGAGLGAVDRAVYLQRYLSYGLGSPLPVRPSGENALYRAAALRRATDAWSDGFWEAEVHHRLESDGATWARAPEGIVTYTGPARLLSLARQRLFHARRYGAKRFEGAGRASRTIHGLASPIVPAILLGRAFRGLVGRRIAVGPWLPALPSFLVLGTAWALGEAVGSLGAGRESRPTTADLQRS